MAHHSYSDKEKEILLAEWREIRESLRYFGNKRFAQLTVYIAANGFLVNALYAALKDGHPLSTTPALTAALIGLVLTVVFYIHEQSSVDYFTKFLERGRALERELGVIELMSKHRPKADRGTRATFWLYEAVGLLWILFAWTAMSGYRACCPWS